jgi:hypothetical protein
MLTSHKAEISVEFLVFVGIILVFFVFFFGIIGGKTKEINEVTLFNDAQNIADEIADEINIAARFEGYYREFQLPEKLVNGYNYSVVFHKELRLVEVKWNSNSVMSTLVTENITGNISSGYNRLRNENGVIVIES